MTDHQKIIKKVADIEAMAMALLHECQQTRKLMEKDGVSTLSADTGLSKIAEEARRNLRARFLNPKTLLKNR